MENGKDNSFSIPVRSTILFSGQQQTTISNYRTFTNTWCLLQDRTFLLIKSSKRKTFRWAWTRNKYHTVVFVAGCWLLVLQVWKHFWANKKHKSIQQKSSALLIRWLCANILFLFFNTFSFAHKGVRCLDFEKMAT